MRPNFVACLCFAFLTVPLPGFAAETVAAVTSDQAAASNEPWEILIQPNSFTLPNAGSLDRVASVMRASVQPAQEVRANDAGGLPVIVPQPVRSPSYIEVYRSIPFIRSEYEANPAYRHEATMELLFGQLRPVTIHKHLEVVKPVQDSDMSKTCLPPPSAGVSYQLNYYYPRHSSYRHPHSWACRSY